MSPTNFPSLIQANNDRWSKMVIDFDAIASMNRVATALLANKARYQAVSAQTNVPWPVIAVIHERECSRNFDLSIAQGDPWDACSIHVPAGRGPFDSWEDAAMDALTVCEHMDQWSHWDTVGGALTRLEMYNGLGYANRQDPLPSPYVWSRTDQYVSGKYVADHVFDPDFVDVQEGCAPLLGTMMLLDASIQADFGWAAAPAQPSLTGDDGILHDTRWLQTVLNQLGADPQVSVDGGWGQHTATALKAFQASAGLAANGRYNLPTLNSLESKIAGLGPLSPPQSQG